MKINLDQPLCIHEIGQRTMQQDSLVPAMGEAHGTDRHFMVGEGPLSDVYLQKASLSFQPKGAAVKIVGNCRVFQIRPGFDLPIFASEGETDTILSDVQVGDWFLLFTDGMCEYLDVEDLMSIMNRPDWTAEHKKDALLDYTSANEDNHSAYLLHVRSVEEEEVEDRIDVSPTKLQEVNITSDIQPQDVDVNGNSGIFDVSAKSLLIVLLVIYSLALVIGFFRGLFG